MRNFDFSSDFDRVFLHLIPLNESFQKNVNRFSPSFTIFGLKRVKVGEKLILYNMEKFYFSYDFDVFFAKPFLMKNATSVTPVLRIMQVKMITYICSTLLCPAKYSVQNCPKVHLFTFCIHQGAQSYHAALMKIK